MASQAEGWQPYPRKWVSLASQTANSEEFTIMSYNILCDRAALGKSGYKYVKEGYLKAVDRHPNIMKEVAQWNPDVLCLQEVESNYLKEVLIPDLEKLGYKWAETDLGSNKEAPRTFYKSDMFLLEKAERHPFCELFCNYLQQRKDTEISAENLEKIREYIARPKETTLTKFRCLKSGKFLTVANLHTFWGDLACPSIQLAEVTGTLNRLYEFAGGQDTCFIITGDFNSTPSYPPYFYLRDGGLQDKVKDRTEIVLADGKTGSLPDLLPEAFAHDFPLKEAYLEVLGHNPEATNCDPYSLDDGPVFIGCLDYIWHNSRTLGSSAVVETPTAEAMREEVGLPSTKFPSDHIFVMARMHFL